MTRIFLLATAALLTASAVSADVLVVDRNGKPRILGMPDKVDGVEITIDNYKVYAIEHSTGVIQKYGYDSIEWLRNSRDKKPDTYKRADLYDAKNHPPLFTTEPESLLDGFDAMATGGYAQAIGHFQRCYQDPEARPVYKAQAYFEIGRCYLATGNQKAALAHFQKWPAAESYYTPQALRFVALILTGQKKYGAAREAYKKMAALPGAPDEWRLRGRLGEVRVDIEERKLDIAEQSARAIAGDVTGKKGLADVRALALGLQAQAVSAGGEKARLPEAEKLLRDAAATGGADDSTRAFVFSRLGDALYAQGKLEEARFPYLRVVEMYPGEPDFVANSLQNAGQCFLDLSGRAEDAKEKDLLMIKGMRLLAECAGRYRGRDSARAAAKTYRSNKDAYYEALKRQDLPLPGQD